MPVSRHPGAAGLGHGERDPEVRHQRLTGLEQDILRLDVAMDHAVAMGELERRRHRAGEGYRLFNAELFFPGELVAQRLPFDVRHDVVEEGVGVGVVKRKDIRMLQVGGDLDLLEEPLRADDRGQLGAQHLERHLAAVLEILGEVDRGHATRAQLPLDAVAIGEGVREAGHQGCHGTRNLQSGGRWATGSNGVTA